MTNTVEITEDTFGFIADPNLPDDKSKNQLVRRFTLVNGAGMIVQILNYGATITSIKVPDHAGVLKDVVLGYDKIDGYLGAYGRNPYFGAVIGRVANRTGKAKFTLNGETFNLSVNNGKNHLHGGLSGFDKRFWESHVEGSGKLTFSYVSRDGEEGYPGEVLAHVTYELTADNQLIIKYQATSSKPTPICLTNHSYFNLSGHEAGDQKLKRHTVHLNADKYTPMDSGLIVTGEIRDVESSVYDFRSNRDLHEMLLKFPAGQNGYDNNFCINQIVNDPLNLVGRVSSSASKITLEVYSDQPGVQFYTSNFLPDPENNDEGIPGKDNAKYFKHGAFCLETQNYPNAINEPSFPNAVLNPGKVYSHTAVFKFTTKKE